MCLISVVFFFRKQLEMSHLYQLNGFQNVERLQFILFYLIYNITCQSLMVEGALFYVVKAEWNLAADV